jgi:signal transduction histidine kinase
VRTGRTISPVARRWLQAERTVAGAIVAGLVVLDVAGALAPADVRVPDVGLTPVVVALSLGAALQFWWRRERPILVLVLAVLAAGIAADLVPPGLASQRTGTTTVLAVYGVASWSAHRRWALVLVALLLAAFFTGGVDEGTPAAEAAATAAAVVALPAALGIAARARRAELEEARQRLAAAERDRDEQARRAVVEERAHIARELHDVVAHHVSLIGVQAGAARTALDADPEASRAALGRIESASRQVVGEMRHLLDALREDDAVVATSPQPRLADLDELVAGFRAAGLEVAVVGRPPEGLGAALDLTCYRLLEEALTNVARHSAATRAEVCLDGSGDEVRLVVRDPGPARAGTEGTGRGRLGMQERVALFGGRIDDGPTAEGGWQVAAVLRRDGGRA